MLSGCPSGELHRNILDGDIDGAQETINWYREHFDGYYLEVQDTTALPEFTPREADDRRAVEGDGRAAGRHQRLALPAPRGPRQPRRAAVHRHQLDGEGREAHEDDGRAVRALRSRDARRLRRAAGSGRQQLEDRRDSATSRSSSAVCTCRSPSCRRARRRGVPRAPLLGRACAAACPTPTRRPKSACATSSRSSTTPASSTTCTSCARSRCSPAALACASACAVQAAASLILYCLGVTDIDPLEVQPRLRALPQQRTPRGARRRLRLAGRPPRGSAALRLERYGEDRVAQIITFGTLGRQGRHPRHRPRPRHVATPMSTASRG